MWLAHHITAPQQKIWWGVIIQYIHVLVCTNLESMVLVHTSMYKYVLIYVSTYHLVPWYTSMYWYIQKCPFLSIRIRFQHLESQHLRYQWLKWYIRVYTCIYKYMKYILVYPSIYRVYTKNILVWWNTVYTSIY